MLYIYSPFIFTHQEIKRDGKYNHTYLGFNWQRQSGTKRYSLKSKCHTMTETHGLYLWYIFLTRHRRPIGCEYTYENHPYGNYFVLKKTLLANHLFFKITITPWRKASKYYILAYNFNFHPASALTWHREGLLICYSSQYRSGVRQGLGNLQPLIICILVLPFTKQEMFVNGSQRSASSFSKTEIWSKETLFLFQNSCIRNCP